jgi:hypothetical protein
MNNMPFNGFGNMYGYQQPATNVTFVTSIEEALYRANGRNCDMVFFDQDKPIFYRVKVDMEGRKSCAQFSFANNQAAQEQMSYEQLDARLKKLEEKLNVTGEKENA